MSRKSRANSGRTFETKKSGSSLHVSSPTPFGSFASSYRTPFEAGFFQRGDQGGSVAARDTRAAKREELHEETAVGGLLDSATQAAFFSDIEWVHETIVAHRAVFELAQSLETMNGVVVGCGEPPSGSTVTATSCRIRGLPPIDIDGAWVGRASPWKVPAGIGLPAPGMIHNSNVRFASSFGKCAAISTTPFGTDEYAAARRGIAEGDILRDRIVQDRESLRRAS